MKKKYDVVGMTCASCQAAVTRAVEKVENVENVNVNLMTNKMEVSGNFDSDKVEKAVQAAGYEAISVDGEKKEGKILVDQYKEMKKRFFISLAFLLPVMILAMTNMFADKINFGEKLLNLFFGGKGAFNLAFLEMLLVTPILIVNKKYFISGTKALIKRTPNMDSLISVGSAASYIYGIIVIFKIVVSFKLGDFDSANMLSMSLYFESSGMILTLITLGKMLESKSKGKATEAISKLVALNPKMAIIEIDGKEERVNTQEVKVGDIVILRSGDSVAVDGEVIFGSGAFSEANITGESQYVEKKIGDKVLSGTTLESGYIKFIAKKVGENSTISEIIRYVEEASNSKAPVQKLADKISGVFVPIVIGISLLTFIIWLSVGYSFDFALNLAISVLVISCPCALGLATPVAIMVASGEGAKRGILIKDGEALQTLSKVNAVVLDKTGTITIGKPKVTDLLSFNGNERELIDYAYSLELSSSHPISKAIIQYGMDNEAEKKEVSNFKSISGEGIYGEIDGKIIKIGSKNYVGFDDTNNIIESLSTMGKTAVAISENGKTIGIIAVKDVEKPSSKKMVESLRRKGIEVYMLTGDRLETAQAVAKNVGIKEVIANVLPIDKSKEIEKLQQRKKVVAFVGDGVNDTVALQTADVGIAIAEGSEIAVGYSDAAINGNDMTNLSNAILLSKKTFTCIKENLFWAFFYNAICIPLAAGALYIPFGITLNPMIGALAMSFSSIFVVLNSLRIKNAKKDSAKIIGNNDDRKVNLSKNESKEKTSNNGEINMERIVKIEGMMCNHCVSHVKGALEQLNLRAEVNLEKGQAVVFGEATNDDIIKAIKECGYNVTQII